MVRKLKTGKEKCWQKCCNLLKMNEFFQIRTFALLISSVPIVEKMHKFHFARWIHYPTHTVISEFLTPSASFELEAYLNQGLENLSQKVFNLKLASLSSRKNWRLLDFETMVARNNNSRNSFSGLGLFFWTFSGILMQLGLCQYLAQWQQFWLKE